MEQPCQIDANADLYGFGIRLGIYSQWLTALFATSFGLESQESGLADAYITFSAALIIALFQSTFKTQIFAIEGAIILYLFFGGLIPFLLFEISKSPLEQRRWRETTIRLIWALAVGYSAWFWIAGRSSQHFKKHDCELHIFLFANVSQRHLTGICKLFFALSIIYGFSFLWALTRVEVGGLYHEVLLEQEKYAAIDVLRHLGNKVRLREEDTQLLVQNFEVAAANREHRSWDATHIFQPFRFLVSRIWGSLPTFLSSRRRPERLEVTALQFQMMNDEDDPSGSVKATAIWFSLGSIVYSITGVELMLRWNQISDSYTVDSVGQLIPFVIGLFGLAKFLFDFWTCRKSTVPFWQIKTAASKRSSQSPVQINPRPSDFISSTQACMQQPDGRWV